MENLPSILTPDLGLLFWMFLAFLVVFFVLSKYGFPVIINMVEKRKSYIDDSLRKAHEASERLAKIQQEGDAILHDAREKQAVMLKEAATTRDSIVEKAHVKAKDESSRLISEARTEIDIEKQNVIRDIRSQVAELSVQIAEKVIREELASKDSQMELINKLLNDISVEKNQA